MQFIQHATVLSLEICQLSPAAPLHIMSPVSVGPPNHLMWFLVPEQKQQCQQSYSCSSCSLSKDNFSVFTDMHLHNSFSSQSLPHCQDKLPQIISLLCQTSFFFEVFLTVICCFAPKWLSVSLFRNNSFSALWRSCHWYLHHAFHVSVLPLTASSSSFCIPITCCRAEALPQVRKLPVSHVHLCFYNVNELNHSAATLIMLAWMGLKFSDPITHAVLQNPKRKALAHYARKKRQQQVEV